MANTTVHHHAERWIVEHGLAQHFPGVLFSGKKMKLRWGGYFAFDAVSEDNSLVVAISTSSAVTASNKSATAKFQKLKTDALYLLHIDSDARRLMVFTEESMRLYFQKEVLKGRFPPSIELIHIPLPDDLNLLVLASRLAASRETTPTAILQAP